MPPRAWQLRVQDLLEAIAAIQEHTAGMDFESFAADRKTVDAVVYTLPSSVRHPVASPMLSPTEHRISRGKICARCETCWSTSTLA